MCSQMQITLKAYHEQQIWFNGSLLVPSMEEYMREALDSAAAHLTIIFSMVGMGDDCITEESFKWVIGMPKMVTACSLIVRLKADMASHKFEQEKGHPPSSVECYMNQHGVSEQETHEELNKQLISAWKDMNEACLKSTAVPFRVLELVLNTARIVQVFYIYGDGLTQAQDTMKDDITPSPFEIQPLVFLSSFLSNKFVEQHILRSKRSTQLVTPKGMLTQKESIIRHSHSRKDTDQSQQTQYQ